METLTSSIPATKILLEKCGERDSSFPRAQITFLPSKNFGNSPFLQLVSLRGRHVMPACALPSESQTDLETATNQETYQQSQTVRVKFQLHKECRFGEHFFIVGDDHMFGLWDPTQAVPLNWSDGHVWSVELDIPAGKSIQYKFIMKGHSGAMLWQPGPDRNFQTHETDNTIIVLEDWENAEDQRIIEEKPLASQNEISILDSGMLVPGINHYSDAVESNFIPVEIPQKPITSFAENIGDKVISEVKEEFVANGNMNMGENILGSNGRVKSENVASSNVEENKVKHGVAVLVPGLPPVTTLPTEGESQNGNTSVGIDQAKNQSLPELYEKQVPESDTQLDKQEPRSDTHQEKTIWKFNDGGQGHEVESKVMNLPEDEPKETNLPPKDEPKETNLPPKDEQQAESNPLADNIFLNDIKWGRRTLKTFLMNLGLL